MGKRRLDSLHAGDAFTDALGRQWRFDGPDPDELGVCRCVLVADARRDAPVGQLVNTSVGIGERDRFLASVEVEHG